VVQAVCEPVPHLPGWMRAVGAVAIQGIHAIHPDDWHYTKAEALARVKQLLTAKRHQLQREHLREVERLAEIGDGLKAGRLPMAKVRA
jgi:hypothetical protein